MRTSALITLATHDDADALFVGCNGPIRGLSSRSPDRQGRGGPLLHDDDDDERRSWLALLVSGLVVQGPGGSDLLACLRSLLPDEGMVHHGIVMEGKW